MELARYFARQGNASAAKNVRTKARTLAEATLAREPENSSLAAELADLLLPASDAPTTIVVPTAEQEEIAWRFTTTAPPAGWMGEAFDDSAWPTGAAGFGGNGSPPGFVIRSLWLSKNIWLRRTFEWKPDSDLRTLLLRIIHDDGFELFLNGQPVLSRQDYSNSRYVVYPLAARVLGLLKPGTNTLCVHCSSLAGPQYIDLGIHGSPSDPRVLQQDFAATRSADPWARLAVAYSLIGDQPALERLLQAHPAAAAGSGDQSAANQDWERAIAEYSQALTLSPGLDTLLAKRAAAYAATNRWNLATADWLAAAKTQPGLAQMACDRLLRAERWSEAAQLGLLRIEEKPDDSDVWLHIVPALVLAGKGADYPGYCQRMARQFSASPNVQDQERMIKACLLQSQSTGLVKQAGTKLASFLEAGAEPAYLRPFAWTTRALLAYRSGDSASAVKFVAKSRELNPRDNIEAQALAVLAMAQHQLKHPEEARRALDEAAQLATRLEADPNHKTQHDVLIAQILLREAQALINAKTK
jgi:tetratricopeptide (TPR) repeat protein